MGGCWGVRLAARKDARGVEVNRRGTAGVFDAFRSLGAFTGPTAEPSIGCVERCHAPRTKPRPLAPAERAQHDARKTTHLSLQLLLDRPFNASAIAVQLPGPPAFLICSRRSASSCRRAREGGKKERKVSRCVAHIGGSRVPRRPSNRRGPVGTERILTPSRGNGVAHRKTGGRAAHRKTRGGERSPPASTSSSSPSRRHRWYATCFLDSRRRRAATVSPPSGVLGVWQVR